jgi:hypothetical protein
MQISDSIEQWSGVRKGILIEKFKLKKIDIYLAKDTEYSGTDLGLATGDLDVGTFD